MKKRFNITGVCIPNKHYMVDTSTRVTKIVRMIEYGDYFVINRPRQYGKTTILYMLNRFLKNDPNFFPIKISFEGIGSESYKNATTFIEAFVLQLKTLFKKKGNTELLQFIETGFQLTSISQLSTWITDLVCITGPGTVLMIDEVDKSCNNQLFLDFLGLLRYKYLKWNEGEDKTFQSVILAGVHDIKSLKAKIPKEESSQFNSPWNIAVDFKVDMTFSPDEILAMLQDYSKQQQIKIDAPLFAKKLFYFTSGYPFLVSYLCRIIDEEILPRKNKKEWEETDLLQAFQMALREESTNFQSVIKSLANDPKLYETVFKMIMNGNSFTYNPHNEVLASGLRHGILREDQNRVKVHNRMYEQLIYDYMSSNLETSTDTRHRAVADSYIRKDGSLDMEKIIRKFQLFMGEQYSTKDIDFIERNGRLLFLTFIKPIINGKGFDFKEVQISEEKRLDVAITYGAYKYIVELKIWHGETYHREGITQLCDYLDRQNQQTGYLLIFDCRKETGETGKIETLNVQNKTILAAWV